MGKASGRRPDADGPFKSRKGFGFHVRRATARPSNTTVRELLSNDRYTKAVPVIGEERRAATSLPRALGLAM